MKKYRKPFSKKRRFKRTSDRKLSTSDLIALDFLWTWKVATTGMIEQVAFSGKSTWWVYKAMRQLKNEGYIQLMPRGKLLNQELWALTELGFEVVLMDRDDITMHRYKPHAPTHDFLATCLQLGSVWKSPNIEKQFLTEQMLSSIALSNFPKKFRANKEHIPDGITIFPGPLKEAVVGYEVDINLKAEDRYQASLNYYMEVKPSLIIWLVRNPWMARRILNINHAHARSEYNEYQASRDLSSKVAFILAEDFKKNVWDAKIINEPYKGHTVNKLHTKLMQSIGKESAKLDQTNLQNVFFQKYKSPQKLNTYKGGDL